MSRRALVVGTGAEVDLALDAFGACANAAPHHATLFYDETSRRFELLNYSEHGTTVDHVLYALDPWEGDVEGEGGDDPARAVRRLVGARRAPPLGPALAPSSPFHDKCFCQEGAWRGPGWEGAALLAHGSLVSFGCLSFVFAVTDAAPAAPVV